MKKRYAIFLFLGCSIFGFSQKIAEKKVQSLATQIEISTLGLDEVVLENSTSEFIEMYLTAENPNQQHLVLKKRVKRYTSNFTFQKCQQKTLFSENLLPKDC